MTPERAFNDGWVWRDGKLNKITSVKKITTRDPETGRPISHIMDMVDANGRDYRITGTVTASLPYSFWPNCMTHLCMTRWECEGVVGWGDTQEVHWTEYIRKFWRKA